MEVASPMDVMDAIREGVATLGHQVDVQVAGIRRESAAA